MKCQTKAFITNLFCKICTVLRHYAFTDVLRQPTGPTFKGQNIQKTKSMNEVTWHNLIFWDCLSSNFFKEAQCFRSQLWFHFQSKNLVDHLDWVILNHWVPQKCVKYSYVPESRPSPSVVQENGYWNSKHWLEGSKIKSGPIQKLKAIKRSMNSRLDQTRHDKKIQSTFN